MLTVRFYCFWYFLKMKIAQIAPLWERVPLATAALNHCRLLTDELVRRGHEVTYLPLATRLP